MKRFDNLEGGELWVEVISHRLGTRLKATENERGIFALTLEIVIPKMIAISNLKNPEREQVRFIKQKADQLMDLLEDIQSAAIKSPYIADIIDCSLSHKAHRMDFKDIYWFADAFQGFLEDQISDSKPGPNSESHILICKVICQIYHQILGVKPGCYDMDKINQSGDVDHGTPYERVCFEINRRYKTGLTWSSMRKASQIYQIDMDRKKPAIH